MTEIPSPGDAIPLLYADVVDVAVLGGVVPEGEGLIGARTFLAVTIMDEEGSPQTINYAFTPWESIRVGIAMGDVAVQTVEMVKAAESEPDAPAVQERKRDTSPYL